MKTTLPLRQLPAQTSLFWLWLLALLLPLAGFFGLRQLPDVNLRLVIPQQHFSIVSLTAYVAFVLSVFTAVVLGEQCNRRVTWLAMGMASISGIFAVHGLTTPGFLMGPNVMVGAAAQQSLFVGGICLAQSVCETDRHRVFTPSQHRWVWSLWSLGMVVYWGMAFFWNTPFEWLQVLDPYLKYVVAFVTIGLYTFSALGAVDFYLREQWTVAPFLVAASLLLGVAVIGQAWGEIWRLSWWSYHVDMLVAFLLILIGLVRTYEQFRTFYLTHYFVLVAAVFLGITFFAAYTAGNSLLAAELDVAARARIEPTLLKMVGALLLLLFAAFLAIVYRGDRLIQERQRSLDQARQRLETILDAQPDGVVVLTGQHTIERANPVAQQWLDGNHPTIHPDALMALLQSVCADPTVEREAEFGPVTLRARASRFADDGVVVLFHDISRLKELDRMRAEFVSTVTHELRTPLTNFKLYLSLLRNGKAEKQAHYLDTLEQENTRLNALVEKVLDLSRLDARKGSAITANEVDLNLLVEQVVDRYTAFIDARQMQVTTNLAADLPVRGDDAMLTQVLVNLLGNALNYTQPGGSVHLATERSGPAQITFTIADNGPGIPAEDLAHIFARFYRGRTGHASNTPGTGLGLAIVKEIVAQHGGEIEVTSEEGTGTVFHIHLPAV